MAFRSALPLIVFSLATFSAAVVDSTSPAGLWKTIDDKTGKPRGLVRIYEENGRLFGRVISSIDPAEANKSCIKCTDYRKDQPVVGMVILRSMQKRGEDYAGGDILDPETGSIYNCKLKLADQGRKLIVRGFLGVPWLGRNQVWLREE